MKARPYFEQSGGFILSCIAICQWRSDGADAALIAGLRSKDHDHLVVGQLTILKFAQHPCQGLVLVHHHQIVGNRVEGAPRRQAPR